MHISVSNKQIVSYLVWLFVIITSTIFFIGTVHFAASVLLYIYNIFVAAFGILYTVKHKNVFMFNPVFLGIYCSIFYCTFMGLYCLSRFNTIEYLKPPTDNETFLFYISCVYLICLFLMLAPYIISLFHKHKKSLKFNILYKNFNIQKTCKYLYYTFPIIIILYFLLCFAAGFTPISALLNPAEFRNASARDLANAVKLFYGLLFTINFFITAQLGFLYGIKDRKFKIYLILFSIYCFFWGILSGGRGTFVTYVIMLSFVYSVKNKIKFNTKNLVITFTALTLLFLFVGAYGTYRNYRTQIGRGGIPVVRNNMTPVQKVLFRLDTYAMSLNFFKYVDKEYGGLLAYNTPKIKELAISQCTLLIPRRIYPQKLEPTHGELTKLINPSVYNNGVHLIYGGVSAIFYEGGLFWLFFNFLVLGMVIMLLNLSIQISIQYNLFQLVYFMFFETAIIQVFNLGLLNEPHFYNYLLKLAACVLIAKYIMYSPQKALTAQKKGLKYD